MPVEPHLRKTHEQYPRGFPERDDDTLLGHWPTPTGYVVVEEHPHGYEIHMYPCYDFEHCDPCAPDRVPANPHTKDGHHFRLCQNRNGPILTVGGDKPRTVLEYLATCGSPYHVDEFARVLATEAAAEAAFRERERKEKMAQELAEAKEIAPTPEDRLEAVIAEVADLRARLNEVSPEK